MGTHLNAGNCAEVKQNGELANKNNFPADLEICSVTFCIRERTENFIKKFSLEQFDECSYSFPPFTRELLNFFIRLVFAKAWNFLQNWSKCKNPGHVKANQPQKMKYQHL